MSLSQVCPAQQVFNLNFGFYDVRVANPRDFLGYDLADHGPVCEPTLARVIALVAEEGTPFLVAYDMLGKLCAVLHASGLRLMLVHTVQNVEVPNLYAQMGAHAYRIQRMEVIGFRNDLN
jgi:hypothetical protein